MRVGVGVWGGKGSQVPLTEFCGRFAALASLSAFAIAAQQASS